MNSTKLYINRLINLKGTAFMLSERLHNHTSNILLLEAYSERYGKEGASTIIDDIKVQEDFTKTNAFN